MRVYIYFFLEKRNNFRIRKQDTRKRQYTRGWYVYNYDLRSLSMALWSSAVSPLTISAKVLIPKKAQWIFALCSSFRTDGRTTQRRISMHLSSSFFLIFGDKRSIWFSQATAFSPVFLLSDITILYSASRTYIALCRHTTAIWSIPINKILTKLTQHVYLVGYCLNN